ncbi:hypothetical protein [Caballeronia calidae]|uniref:hypothetical protein n=1 Tax=Caballeronia calidae TaxID=1777139 RepID=UPI001E549CDE|nr:hypothetical protein [Caballeronia calidae]
MKTRAFKMLVTAVGNENIALALDSNLRRVKELEEGEGFTSETAFHMETTLGLPDGFFDQANPVLLPETIARLKSPLKANADMAHAREDVNSGTVVDQTTALESPEHPLPAELEMPQNERSDAVQKAAQHGTAKAARKTAHAEKAPHAASKGLRQPGLTPSPTPNDSRALAEIRRVNLHTLTQRNGSKAQLGRLLEMSQSNIAHRLHGQKRMDDVEARRVTDKLGLPAGWLDKPRKPTDVPEAIADLLSPPSRRLSAQPRPDKAHLSAKSRAPASPQEAPTVTSPQGEHASPVAADHLTLSAVALPESAAEPPSPQTSNEDLSMKPLDDGTATLATADLPEAHSPTLTTSLETLQGIAPIAEALLKTLAGKARTGRLDETKALQVLQQIMRL